MVRRGNLRGRRRNTRGRRGNTGTSIVDLPEALMVAILLRLRINEIVMCKSTCKSWCDLISSTDFAKVLFAHSTPRILVQNVWSRQSSRMLYSIDPAEINFVCSTPLQNLRSRQSSRMLYSIDLAETVCCSCNGTKLNIPVIKNNKDKYAPKYILHMMNSCNGFICLVDRNKCNPMAVCNPLRNEYVQLPETSNVDRIKMFGGLGFCQETNEYKVLRVRETDNKAEVHTLGMTKSWKSIGFAPFFQAHHVYPIYLNGVLYWISDKTSVSFLLSFDCSSECFGASFPTPPISPNKGTSLGIIADSICLSAVIDREIHIWRIEMENGGWSKLMSLDIPGSFWEVNRCLKSISYCSKCPAFWTLYYAESNPMEYFDHIKRKWKKFRFHEDRFRPSIILHTPSLSSLKDVTGANTKSMKDPVSSFLISRFYLVPVVNFALLSRIIKYKISMVLINGPLDSKCIY